MNASQEESLGEIEAEKCVECGAESEIEKMR